MTSRIVASDADRPVVMRQMFATAAWLAWVLGLQAGHDAVFGLTLATVLLAFAGAHPNLARAEEGIRRELGLTPARYVLLLHRLIDTQQSLDIDPVLTHRLRRIRDEDRAETARRLGATH